MQTNINLNELTEAINANECVLVLGPNLAINTDGVLLTELLADELATEIAQIEPNMLISNRKNLAYIAKVLEDSYLIQQRLGGKGGDGHILLAKKVCDFYAKHQNGAQSPPPVYDQLARMGFSVIINTNPDRLLIDAYENAGNYSSDKNFHYYHFANPTHNSNVAVSEKNISPKTPLIYNLFGSTDNPDSLVITEKDQLQFLDSILQQEATASIPDSVAIYFVSQRAHEKRKTFLFLGFDFEQWQLRLLLHLFNRYQPNPNAFALQKELSDLNRFFYEKNFGFTFAETSPADFLTELKANREANKKSTEIATGLRLVLLHHQTDVADCNLLEKQLAGLETQKLVAEIWHTGKALASDELDTLITEKINTADMVLLLVSHDFLADDTLYNYAKQALQRGSARCVLVPIIVRPCNIDQTEFAELPTICPDPNEEKAISEYENPLEAWRDTAATIQKIAQKLLNRKKQQASWIPITLHTVIRT